MFHKLLLKSEAQISPVQKNMANHISLQLITASLKLYPLVSEGNHSKRGCPGPELFLYLPVWVQAAQMKTI